MNTIGLIGGMSWESTATYYRLINEGVKERLGGLHSADILMRSIDFDPIEKLQMAEDWKSAGDFLVEVARGLEKGGADLVLICTNTMHIVAPHVADGITVPLLHIADAAGAEMESKGVTRAGLLGTKFTMQQDFYKQRISDTFGIEMLTPNEDEQDFIHSVIYNELCVGALVPESRKRFLEIIEGLSSRGAEGVVLGCTEIPLLVNQTDTDTPIFDTTSIHARAAVAAALD